MLKRKVSPILAFCVASIFLRSIFVPASGHDVSSAGKITSSPSKPFTGDFNEMVERRLIRVLIPYSKPFYFFCGTQPRGTLYNLVLEFEKNLNQKLKTKHTKIHTVVLPTSREKLIPYLESGMGDIAIDDRAFTNEQSDMVDFCTPVCSGIDEILLTGESNTSIHSFADLSGKEVYAPSSSNYCESLQKLSKSLRAAGREDVRIVAVEENLEDEDLIEFVNAGLINHVIVDSHKAKFWAQIFSNVRLHPDIRLRTEGRISWMVRKDNPQLKNEINAFSRSLKEDALFSNSAMILYFRQASYITDSNWGEHMKRFQALLPYFEKYGEKYGFDSCLLAGLAYQESKLNQNLKGPTGTIGVMQILPATAKTKNIGIHDIAKVDPNIHAGAKYLRFMADTYFADAPEPDDFNKTLFACASYSAGPVKVAKMRQEAKKMGLDPNLWFKNVEVAAAKKMGRQTVQYVSNIFKYYTAYKLVSEKRESEPFVESSKILKQ